MIWRTDLRGRVVYVNAYVQEFLGLTQSESIGRSINDYFSPESALLVTQGVQATLFATPPSAFFNAEVEYRHKDGRLIPGELRMSAQRDRSGRVVALNGVSRENSERRRAQDALRTTQRLLEQTFEQSPVPMVLVSMPDMIIRIVNPATRNFLGVEDEPSVTNTSLMELKPSWQDFDLAGKLGTVAELPLARSLAGHRTEGQERRIVRKDGTIRDALVSGAPIFDDEGRVIAGYLIMTDISQRRLAEEALRQSEAWYSTTLAAVDDGLWDWHVPSGNAVFSSRYYAILGYDDNEFPACYRSWRLLVHPDDIDRVEQELQTSVERDVGFYIDLRMKTKSGEWRWVSTRGKAVDRDEQGKALRMVGTLSDITKRKRAEQDKAQLEGQLLQAQKMESIGRLAGGVAHDFNNMLAVILGNVDIAIDQVDPTHPLRGDLIEIRQAADRSADLTRQLLAFARKQTVAPKVLDLNNTVTGMLKMLQRLIGENIHLTWQPTSELWPVKVDPSQVDQILANLCVNARDAIGGVGKMTIETHNGTLDEEFCAAHPGFVPGDYVRLAVSDNGSGIDKETLLHLFEPFFTTKAMGKGTGLGLATVYGIVQQNHGFINVSSDPERGTTFTIYLPRYVGEAQLAEPSVHSRPAPRGRETILLVEDEPAILKMATRMLEQQGYTVLAARTPGAAIHMAGEHSGEIHLVVTDVVLPEMNGRDLATSLLSIHPFIKCLYMSGYTTDVIAHHGVLDEGVHFIEKPFSNQGLAAKVRQALASDERR
jgi:PAS domain S-box-containing protein